MSEIAKKHRDRLSELTKHVETWQRYFRDNVDRYKKFMRFVYKSTLDDHDIQVLQSVGKPTLSFNILASYIARLRGEFANQQPGLEVTPAEGIPLEALTPAFAQTRELVESHLRAVFFDGTNDMMEYNVFTDILIGGFSALRIFTTYVSPMSFEQKICIEKCSDPCLIGFDTMATTSHKGDGRFAFELYPMTKGAYVDEFGEEALEGVNFGSSYSEFNWAYQTYDEDIVIVCDFYEKHVKKEKIVKLSNGYVVREREYKKIVAMWDELGIIALPPEPVGKPRYTMLESIVRYRFTQGRMLDFTPTNYSMLPYIFVDGDSVMLEEGGNLVQFTKPYVYAAEGIQKLKDYSGNTLANELENLVQHKFIVPIESIPEKYTEAYQNVQKADILAYNHFLDENRPEVTLPPPTPVVRAPIPPEIGQTFGLTDEMTTAILGTFDNSGLKRADVSGVAIARSQMVSNMSAMPYIIGWIKGINRAAQAYLDLLPKYVRTPRSIPVLLPSGKREYREVNNKANPQSISLSYDSSALDVKVEVGINFAMQKEIALQTILNLMNASPLFAQFINQEGLQVLLDNIDIRGIDDLKEKAVKFEKQLQEQNQAAQQQQQQQAMVAQKQTELSIAQLEKQVNSPTLEEVELYKAQQKAAVDSANVAVKNQEAEIKFLELLNKIRAGEVEMYTKQAEIQAEQTRTAVDLTQTIAAHMSDLNEKNDQE